MEKFKIEYPKKKAIFICTLQFIIFAIITGTAIGGSIKDGCKIYWALFIAVLSGVTIFTIFLLNLLDLIKFRKKFVYIYYKKDGKYKGADMQEIIEFNQVNFYVNFKDIETFTLLKSRIDLRPYILMASLKG